ncbi:MAG: hypothetical protein ABJC74_04465 [Gemmatimonadota bacterium]
MSRDNLHTYLQDHLAGARSALEVLAHLRDSADDAPLRAIAGELHAEVTADRDLLAGLAQEVGGGSNPLKEAGAWLAEKVARLKLGSVGGAPSGLPALEAVEFLCLGILGKVALWDALAAASAVDLTLRSRPYAALRDSARTQHDRLELHRVRLAASVLS